MADTASQLSDYELWSLLDGTAFVIYRLRQMELAKFGLTVEQAAILRTVQAKGGHTTAKEIEDLTLRQHHSISILISRMIRLGLVERQKLGGGKGYKILITSLGKVALRRITTDSIESVFCVLTPRKRQQLAVCLHSLHQRARELLGVTRLTRLLHLIEGVSEDTSWLVSKDAEGLLSDYMLWSLLDSARFAVARLRGLELAQFGLTIEQASILRIMKRKAEPVTGKELEEATLRQHHSISTLTDRMTRMGLLNKSIPHGRKIYKFAITARGEDVLARMTTAALAMTFSVLSETEKRHLTASLCLLDTRARSLLGIPA